MAAFSQDDIPIAQRTSTFPPSTHRSPSGLRLFIIFGSLLTSALVIAFKSPLLKLWQPSPVSGLQARLSADGRLLGHFPYPEARFSKLQAVEHGMFLRPDAAASFEAMQRAAAEDGISLILLSGFRSLEEQRKLFFEVKADRNQTASDRAKVSAPPGYSEHSTGYAIDIGDGRNPGANLSPSFVQTPAYNWLQKHAARYQYTLSFPKGNSQGVSFEPWHWRFEGSTEALRIFEPAHRLQSTGGGGAETPAP